MLSPVTTSASAEPMALPRYRNSSDEIDPNIISAGSQASQYGALSNTKRCQYEALYGRLRRPREWRRGIYSNLASAVAIAGESAPYAIGDVGDQPELAFLHRRLDRVALDSGGEAALSRERELIAREKARGLFDTPGQLVGRFQHVALGRHQAEHDALAARHVGQRFEGARARVVVLEQELVVVAGALEDLARDRVVAAAGQPAAVIVAAAQMQPKSYARLVGERVENLDALADHAFVIDTALLENDALHLWIDEVSQLGRVNLDVYASQARQFGNLLADNRGAVGEHVERIAVGGG